jgi:hypothetical protein
MPNENNSQALAPFPKIICPRRKEKTAWAENSL